MHFLIWFLLLFSSPTTTGQVRYVPIFINQCTSDLNQWPYWYVTDSLGNHYDPNISNEEVTLPQIGQYYLHNDLISSILLDSIPILVQHLITRDTFYTEALFYQSKGIGAEGYFYFCDSLANGRLIDYYYNGSIRKEGSFIAGEIKDSFKTYYRRGSIEQLTVVKDSDHNIYYTFHPNGQLAYQAEYGYPNGYIYKYYPNGQLAYESIWSKNILKTYYPTGILQSKKTKKQYLTYFPTGRLKEKQYLWKKHKYKMKSETNPPRFHFWQTDYYRWKFFDKKGHKLLTINYQAEDNSHSFYTTIEHLFKKESSFMIDRVKLHQTNQKIVYVYDKESSTFVFFLYQKKGVFWVKQKTMTKKEVGVFVQQYINNLP